MRAAALLGSILLVACGEPRDDTPRTYVVHVLRVPAPVDGVAVGADLDETHSVADPSDDAACDRRQLDFASEYDGRDGIDAALNAVVPTIDGLLADGLTFDDGVAARIASGRLLLALEVVTGPPVRVTAYLVEPAGELTLDGGRLAADQPFVVATTLGQGEGELRDGRVTVRLGDLAAAIPVGVDSPDVELDLLPVPLRSVEVRFDDGDAQLGRGELGGMMDVEEFVRSLPPPTVEPIMPTTDVVRELADVNPRADDPTRCAHLSIGLAFEAIPAQLEIAP